MSKADHIQLLFEYEDSSHYLANQLFDVYRNDCLTKCVTGTDLSFFSKTLLKAFPNAKRGLIYPTYVNHRGNTPVHSIIGVRPKINELQEVPSVMLGTLIVRIFINFSQSSFLKLIYNV